MSASSNSNPTSRPPVNLGNPAGSANSNSANAYLRTRVLTAPPEELRLLLLEGAIRFCRQGRDGIEAKDWEGSFNGFSKCRNILIELMTSMRPEIDPELCQRLQGLYTFLYTQLIEAGHEKSMVKADKVLELLEYERETWVMLLEKLKQEKAAADGARAALTGSEEMPPAKPDAYKPMCVQG